jgi:hypothetical protein
MIKSLVFFPASISPTITGRTVLANAITVRIRCKRYRTVADGCVFQGVDEAEN